MRYPLEFLTRFVVPLKEREQYRVVSRDQSKYSYIYELSHNSSLYIVEHSECGKKVGEKQFDLIDFGTKDKLRDAIALYIENHLSEDFTIEVLPGLAA